MRAIVIAATPHVSMKRAAAPLYHIRNKKKEEARLRARILPVVRR